MLRRLFLRRLGPVGLVLSAYDVWRRVPEKQRRRLVQGARTHGPRLAANVLERRRRRRTK